MIVVDASTMVAALIEDGHRGVEARRALATSGRLFAPQHLSLEVVHSLRGLVMAKKLQSGSAEEAFVEFTSLTLKLFPVTGAILERVWRLRHNVTPYDAAYVAIAEHLRVPLVTGDVRLAAASGPECEIRVLR